MAENENPIKSTENAEKLVKELWDKIIFQGLFNYPKNDICDYLLYLFNRHSENGFLDNNSNDKNARILKTSTTKIKASKKNIAAKFMDDNEREAIFGNFLDALKNNKIAIKNSSKKGYFKITLENPNFKQVLEEKLKELTQDTFEIPSFNTEKIEIPYLAFIQVMEQEIGPNETHKKTLDDLKKKHLAKKLEDTAQYVKEIVNFVSGVLALG